MQAENRTVKTKSMLMCVLKYMHLCMCVCECVCMCACARAQMRMCAHMHACMHSYFLSIIDLDPFSTFRFFSQFIFVVKIVSRRSSGQHQPFFCLFALFFHLHCE